MQIKTNNIFQNTNNKMNFSAQNSKKEEKSDKKSNNIKLVATLAGLAAVGVALVLISRNKVGNKSKVINKSSNESLSLPPLHIRIKEGEKKLENLLLPPIDAPVFKTITNLLDSEKNGANGLHIIDPIYILQTKDKGKAKNIVEIITQMTGSEMKEIDVPEKNLTEELKKEFQKASEEFSKTRTRTFLFVKNLDGFLMYKNEGEQCELLKKQAQESYTTIFYPSDKPEYGINSIVKIKGEVEEAIPAKDLKEVLTLEQATKVEQYLNEFHLQEQKTSLHSMIANYDHFREFAIKSIGEKAGVPLDEYSTITNGIILEGQDQFNIEAVKTFMPKLAQMDLVKIKYDHSKPLESLKNIVDSAKKAELNFNERKIRTMIQVENLQDLLLYNRDINLDNIAKFNRFAENCSEKYHTTLVFSTDNISKLEPASVAPHRFGIKLRIT